MAIIPCLAQKQPWWVWCMNCAEQTYGYFDYLYYCSLWKGLPLTSAPLCWELHRETKMMTVATKHLLCKYQLWRCDHVDRWEGQHTGNTGKLRTVVSIQDFLAVHTLGKVCKDIAYFIHLWQWTFLHWSAREIGEENEWGFVSFVDYKLSIPAAWLLQIICGYLGKRET